MATWLDRKLSVSFYEGLRLRMLKDSTELLVASVFAGHENDGFWLKTQLKHLQSSVGAFDHAVYLNNASEEMFSASTVIGKTTSPRLFSQGHLDALNEIVAYCRAHPHKHYLILDSDCFPIRNDWMDVLLESMNRHDKRFAAPVRTENLDTFPHPSVVFTGDLDCLEFGFKQEHNLLYKETNDIMCVAPRESWFPLVRTNRVSRHPVIGSIYYDSFYHHGCGSREFKMRSTHFGYYDPVIDRYPDADDLMKELREDPGAFVSAMR